MSPSPSNSSASSSSSPQNWKRALLAALAAWVVPGGGHVLLKRPARGAIFFILIALALIIGAYYQGRLPWVWSGSPLQRMATLGAMGSGGGFFLMHSVLGYEGDLRAPGFEYGSAFILTAGLMNLLLVLDAWDIAWGKEKAAPSDAPESTSDGNAGGKARKTR